MRAVSFVNKLELEINGNIMKDAIVLGDVDNDQRNELAVGSVNGELQVFKGSLTTKPGLSATGLGMITSIIIGDITNSQKNSLVVLSGEGFCYIFDVPSNINDELATERERKLNAFHIQQLPSSSKMTKLADIDNDGNLELIIGLTDRVVRTYRWTHLSVNPDGTGGDSLVALNKWELANQIGSVSIHSNQDDTTSILVAQPGAKFVRLQFAATSIDTSSQTKELMLEKSLDYQSVTSVNHRNPNVTTEVLGGVHSKPGQRPIHFAVATLDGMLMLVDGDTSQLVWSLQLDHQLFCLNKLDITGDGREEVIVSSWDGHTFIVDYNQNTIKFQFEESISGFTVGNYCLTPGAENTPCMVYATLSGRVVLYYDIQLPRIPLTSLINAMDASLETAQLLSKLGLNEDTLDLSTKLQQLYRYCLYNANRIK